MRLHLWLWRVLAYTCLVLGVCQAARAGSGQEDVVISVRSESELQQAVQQAQPGTKISVAPGVYQGGLTFTDVRGEEGKPVVIAAADPSDRPVFYGGNSGLHFVNPAFLELHDLSIRGAARNGLNIDDGGSRAFTAHDIVLQRITVMDVNPSGNHDGIKLSGLLRVRVENCVVVGWGGSAIDMVGVHGAIIEGCKFHNKDSIGTGVQAKGGSADIVIRRNRFEHAGQRAVNIGGSTGPVYFRPPLTEIDPPYAEARNITVQGNTFIGSLAPVAFVGVEGSLVSFNTIYRPTAWIVRILQETRDEGFLPSCRGAFADNIVVWRTDELRSIANIGPGTAPETFSFARNWWYAVDNPARSTPVLPVPESDGVVGIDPAFVDAEAGDLELRDESPVRQGAVGCPSVGAEAFECQD